MAWKTILKAVAFILPFVATTSVQADPTKRFGLAVFEDLGGAPTLFLRADSLQRTLGNLLRADHDLAPVLLREATRSQRIPSDPNTQLLPPRYRTGNWRGDLARTTRTDWLDAARKEKLEIVVVGTFEEYSGDLRFVLEGFDPASGQSLFTEKVEGTTSELIALTNTLVEKIARKVAGPPKDSETARTMEEEKPPLAGVEETVPTADDHYENGYTLTRTYEKTEDLKYLEGAAEEYRAALALDPDHFKSLNNLGTVVQTIGTHTNKPEMIREAIGFYDRVLTINPKYFRAMENAALAYRVLGQNDKAVKLWEEALLYEDREEVRKAIRETLDQLAGSENR